MRAFHLFLMAAVIGVAVSPVWGSSKIFQGPIEKVSGSTIFLRSHFTPYASAGLYHKYLNDGKKDGELLSINLKSIHTTYIDDVPATLEEMKAVAKVGVRVLPFMNRKQWHQVSITVRDQNVLVGYVESVEGKKLNLSRPQADWPAQNSNREAWSAKDFPDRKFSVDLSDDAIGMKDGKKAAVKSVLKAKTPVIVIPEAKMRVEWIPNPDDRWDPEQEPLLGNFDEYPKRQDPNIDKTFYAHAVTGMIKDGKMIKKKINNYPSNKKGSMKEYNGWMIDALHGPKTGEFFVPSRGHKTGVACGGYFNTFPRFPFSFFLKEGRQVTSWPYRKQIATNRLLVSARAMQATGTITNVSKDQITIEGYIEGKKSSGTVKIDPDATFHKMGIPIGKSEAFRKGNFIRIYPGGPQTIVTSSGAK